MLRKHIVFDGSDTDDPRSRAIVQETALLCTRLLTSPQGGVIGTGGRLGFVAPLDSEDALVVAANVAFHLVRQGRRIALVEGDLRHPRLADACGEAATPGFSELLQGVATIAQLPVWARLPQLVAVPAGVLHAAPLSLDDRALDSALQAIDRTADTALVALPRLLATPEALLLAQRMDAVVLVVRANTTGRRDVERSAALIAELGVPLVGTVLTSVDHVMPVSLESRL